MKRFYRNYIFDLYGTLADIHTDENKPELWKQFGAFLRGKGIFCEPQELKMAYFSACARLQREAEAKLADAGIPGPAEIDILEVWCSIADVYGLQRGGLSMADQLEISHAFRRLSTEKLHLYPGAKELLERLRAADRNVILLTNAQASFTMQELEELGTDGAFDRIFISSDAGVKKPSRAFFSLPAQNGFLPAESLMVGNDDRCDCRGAAAAGMDSLYIPTEQSPALSGPLPENCREIKDLKQVSF